MSWLAFNVIIQLICCVHVAKQYINPVDQSGLKYKWQDKTKEVLQNLLSIFTLYQPTHRKNASV